MKIRVCIGCLVAAIAVGCGVLSAETKAPSAAKSAAMDRDLMEVTIPQLEALYRSHKYTVTAGSAWYHGPHRQIQRHLSRGQNVDTRERWRRRRGRMQRLKPAGADFHRGPLWGVPIVTKANTSVKGLITTDGWKGYMIPGHELVAPKDATIVAKLRAAGAVIIGQTKCRILPRAIRIAARLMGARETRTTCASAQEAPPAAR